jgi:DNA transposition AAA+ family ATPase
MTVLSNIITPTNVLTATNTATLTNKTWNSNTIGVAYGGTGLTSVGTAGNVLTSNGSAWVSSTPAAGTAIGLVRAVSINCILP